MLRLKERGLPFLVANCPRLLTWAGLLALLSLFIFEPIRRAHGASLAYLLIAAILADLSVLACGKIILSIRQTSATSLQLTYLEVSMPVSQAPTGLRPSWVVFGVYR